MARTEHKPVNRLYSYTIYTFKRIDPYSKYSEFHYTELDSFDEVNVGDCTDEKILYINGSYYQYVYSTMYNTKEKTNSLIQFKDKNKLVAEVIDK
jgi:hypothetical protein